MSMAIITGRRAALQAFSLGIAAGAALVGAAPCVAQAGASPPLIPPGARELNALTRRLANAPRRRDFKAVPMILTNPTQWDHEALSEVIGYKPAEKQVWDNTDIGSPWLNLMRNALNTQVWSFRHPDFLAVSITHGTAHLALYDQTMWDKYQLTKLAGDTFKTNTLIEDRKAGSVDPANFEDPTGVFSAADNSIPALMRRAWFSCRATMRFSNRRPR
jgi:hypothetical protein